MKSDAPHCEAPRACQRTTLCPECRWCAYVARRFKIGGPVQAKATRHLTKQEQVAIGEALWRSVTVRRAGEEAR